MVDRGLYSWPDRISFVHVVNMAKLAAIANGVRSTKTVDVWVDSADARPVNVCNWSFAGDFGLRTRLLDADFDRSNANGVWLQWITPAMVSVIFLAFHGAVAWPAR